MADMYEFLKKQEVRVRDFCKEHGLPFILIPYFELGEFGVHYKDVTLTIHRTPYLQAFYADGNVRAWYKPSWPWKMLKQECMSCGDRIFPRRKGVTVDQVHCHHCHEMHSETFMCEAQTEMARKGRHITTLTKVDKT